MCMPLLSDIILSTACSMYSNSSCKHNDNITQDGLREITLIIFVNNNLTKMCSYEESVLMLVEYVAKNWWYCVEKNVIFKRFYILNELI